MQARRPWLLGFESAGYALNLAEVHRVVEAHRRFLQVEVGSRRGGMRWQASQVLQQAEVTPEGAKERFKPRVRHDLDSTIAAHMLFQGLRAVMVIGAVARPELTRDPRLRHEMEALIVRYLRPD